MVATSKDVLWRLLNVVGAGDNPAMSLFSKETGFKKITKEKNTAYTQRRRKGKVQGREGGGGEDTSAIP